SQERRARDRADVVVVGTLQIDSDCKGFGNRCLGRLTITEIQRGVPNPEISVRFQTTESMCDGLFWPGARSYSGQFYLKRDARSDTYSLVEFVWPQSTDE